MFKIWKKEKQILLNLLESEINLTSVQVDDIASSSDDIEYIREANKYYRTIIELQNRLKKIKTVD